MNICLAILLVFLCICLSAFASGLTIGLVTLQESELNVDDETHDKIRDIISNRHLLLVTLLITNTIVNESLPIFLEELMPPGVSATLATCLVLVFGEIIPSAIFIGTNKLKIISPLIPIVRILNIIFFPLSYPIGKLLDKSIL